MLMYSQCYSTGICPWTEMNVFPYVRQFWKLLLELSQRRMKRKRRSMFFHFLYTKHIFHWLNWTVYEMNTIVVASTKIDCNSTFYLFLDLRSFQFHDVFHLDNENRAEDMPTLIDRKVCLMCIPVTFILIL